MPSALEMLEVEWFGSLMVLVITAKKISPRKRLFLRALGTRKKAVTSENVQICIALLALKYKYDYF